MVDTVYRSVKLRREGLDSQIPQIWDEEMLSAIYLCSSPGRDQNNVEARGSGCREEWSGLDGVRGCCPTFR